MNPLGEVDIFGIKTYTWKFGDGAPDESSAYLPTATHTFAKPGAYTVTLTVADFQGATDAISVSVNVGTLPKKVVVDGDIASAIRALNSKPGIISIPPGTFSPRPVNVPAGVIIEGTGPSKTRLVRARFVAADNVRITGLELDGQGASRWLDLHHRHNLLVDHCETHHHEESARIGDYASATFEDNYIRDNGEKGLGYGLEVISGSYVMVRRNRFERNRHAIAGAGKSGNVPSEYVSFPTGYDFLDNDLRDTAHWQDQVVDMHPTGHGRIRICRNTIDGTKNGLGLLDGWGEIKDNRFKNLTHWAIKLGEPRHNQNWIASAGVRHMVIEGNKFENVAGRYCVDYGTDLTIDGRKVTPPFKGNNPP